MPVPFFFYYNIYFPQAAYITKPPRDQYPIQAPFIGQTPPPSTFLLGESHQPKVQMVVVEYVDLCHHRAAEQGGALHDEDCLVGVEWGYHTAC